MHQERKGVSPDLFGTPLTARSIIASLLLGMQPPRHRTARIVRWCRLFGVTENAARVALSRMVERGELRAADGSYELAGTILDRQATQGWAIDPVFAAWDGSWHIAVVTKTGRSAPERVALRAAATRVRLAEQREGVWTRPANLDRSCAPNATWALLDAQCSWWRGTPRADAEQLADTVFGLADWAARAALLTALLVATTEQLTAAPDGSGGSPAPNELAASFLVGAAALQHLHRDPLLPEELLAAGWPGAALRHAYRSYQTAFSSAVAAYLR